MGKNKLPYVANKEDIIKLFEAVYIPKMAIAMFVSLMCGLRINEIRSLKVNDINLHQRKILIRNSKNPKRSKQGYGKDRIVPLPECAVSPIKKWLDVIGNDSVWFLPSGKSPLIPVSKEYLEGGFDEARTRAGLKKIDYEIKYKANAKSIAKKRNQYTFKWHTLRHYYAIYIYEKTRDLYAVSKLLGHNQISTTQIYAKVSDKVLRESVDFSFNMPTRTKIFQNNPTSALNKNIGEVVKNKTPIQLLEERFARGEISASDFQTGMRLLKVKKDYFDNEEEKQKIEYETSKTG